MKRKIKIGFVKVVILILMTVTSTIICQSGKPDLTITDVKLDYIRLHNDHKPGEPVRAGDNPLTPIFYITVKNIGNADFSDAFYIAYTNDEMDIIYDRYSHLSLVNREKNNIKVNDSLLVRLGSNFSKQNSFKFIIWGDGKSYNGDTLPVINEANYKNNTYECSFDNFK